jgi:uncharacterized protein with PIN domain
VPHATLRFYAELNDFLPPRDRHRPVERSFSPRTSIKDLIEAAGVPHTEVDLVLVNGVPAGFDRPIEDGDRISVYPVFESIDIGEVTRVRPEPLRELRFVLDVHLGRLAAYLRLAGFDAVYGNALDDPELAAIAAGGRVLLTRDQGLLKRRAITRGYWLRATSPREQLVEVLRRFDLAGAVRPFTRCLRCNALLRPVDKADVIAELQPRTRQHYDEFFRCAGCGRIYWRGGHFSALRALVERATNEARRSPPLSLSVDCYAGYRGEETPVRFRLDDRPFDVERVEDRWLAPDHRYFKVITTGGGRYILRHDVTTGTWELTMFERPGGSPT